MTYLNPALSITSAQATYLDTQMQQVSRSFALVVPWLEAPLNHYLATAYLLCRVVDNIEDCTQPVAWKQQRFEEAALLLGQPERAGEVLSGWQQERWPGLSAGEEQLMGVTHGEGLWRIYGHIPEASRRIIRHWVLEMITGMSHLDAPEQAPHFVDRGGVRVLAQESDYNQYCYVVAGTVGYMATELIIQHYRLANGVGDSLLADCEACGRSLQKTNIVKDFAEDLARGVSYLPDAWLQMVDYAPLLLRGAPPSWSRRVLGNVLGELREATRYVLALPYEASGYRMASLMSMLPAYQTILLAAKQREQLFTAQHQVKISRPTMARCIYDAKRMIDNNEAVQAYSQRLEQEVLSMF